MAGVDGEPAIQAGEGERAPCTAYQRAALERTPVAIQCLENKQHKFWREATHGGYMSTRGSMKGGLRGILLLL